MAIAHVLEDHDFSDLVMRDQIAEVFLFFLPGVASQLKSIALIDEKYGHKVPSVCTTHETFPKLYKNVVGGS